MRVSLLYLGCRVNQAEIAEMEAELRTRGHEIVALDGHPDTCIINTCTVTKKSDNQSRQLVRRASRTGAKVLVTGCYAELNPSDIENIAGKDSIVSNHKKPYIINEFMDISSSNDSYKLTEPLARSKYFLKVQDGCDNQCTYCSVWMARGRSRSIEVDEVIRSAQQAEASGYMEIDLTGIHLGMYGRDLAGNISGGVGMLLETLLKKTNKCRFRLSSLEVSEVDERIADLLMDNRVCRHLHIPLQSGDDGVLREMNRDYTSAQYINRIEWLHDRISDIGLGADVIAGFPSESLEAFERTHAIVGELPFTYLHVFPYSSRPGTAASKIPDMVGAEERKKRAAILRIIGERKRTAFQLANIGKDLEILLESQSDDGLWRGTSDNYLKVKCLQALLDEAGKECSKGRLVNIEAQAVEGGFLVGNPAWFS